VNYGLVIAPELHGRLATSRVRCFGQNDTREPAIANRSRVHCRARNYLRLNDHEY